MERKSHLIVLTGVALAGVPVSATAVSNGQQTSRPNILMVVCEDISPYLGCYGDRVAVTPRLDFFSEEGILHTHMFTSVGVSAPSRYSLITGRYASTDGANYMRVNYFNKEFSTVPPSGVKCYTEFLRQQGYYCTNNAKTDYQFAVPVAAWDEQGEKAHWKHAPVDQPFFAVFNLNITHESQIWKNTHLPLSVSPDSVQLPPYYPDNAIVRHDHAVLYTNIAKMDTQFGQLLDELERSGRADHTIVIFYSDNGGPLPRAKREIMDSGTRVPFMIRFPNRYGAGAKNDALNMFVDIPATVLALAGIQVPAYMHGRPMYEGKHIVSENSSTTPLKADVWRHSKKRRKFVFGATDRFDEQVEKRASIRTERYLYIYNYMPSQPVYRPVDFRLSMPMMRNMLELYEAHALNAVQRRWFELPQGCEELYDCEDDPHQIHNLVGDSRYTSHLQQMRKAFRKEWIEAYNQDWERFSEADFVKKMWPDNRKPQVEPVQWSIDKNTVKLCHDLNRLSASYQLIRAREVGKNQSWKLYSTPVVLKEGEVMTVRLERIGYEPSLAKISLIK